MVESDFTYFTYLLYLLYLLYLPERFFHEFSEVLALKKTESDNPIRESDPRIRESGLADDGWRIGGRH